MSVMQLCFFTDISKTGVIAQYFYKLIIES